MTPPLTSRAKRVMHLASGDLWGGAESQLLALCRAQRRLGLDVSMLLLNEGLLATRAFDADLRVIVLSESSLSPPALLRKLTAILKHERPNVLHTHRTKENVLGSVAAGIAGVPVCVRTVHGDFEPAVRRPSVRQWLARAIDGLCARFLQDASVAVSEELAARLARRRFHGPSRVIPNGVDVELIRAEATGAAPLGTRDADVVRVCAIGRLVPVKRIDLFLRACAELVPLEQRSIEAYVIGDGPLRAQLERFAGELKSVRANFIGFSERPAAWLDGMDLMVITSDHEGLPMSLLEAMALGVPVVSRSVGGIPSVLGFRGYGHLVDSDSPCDIAAAMHAVLSDKCCSASPTLPESLTADGMARRYVDLYSTLLAESDTRSHRTYDPQP